MKFYLQSPDAENNIDPTILHGIIDFMPGRVSSMAQADFVLVPIAYRAGYRFNEELWTTHKPVVVLDFLEMGWNSGDKPNVLGNGDMKYFEHLSSLEWTKLDLRFRDAPPPELTLKRELFERDRNERLLPCEWPCRLPIPPVQSKAEFEARPIEVFNCWGLSNPCRPKLHGEIFRNAHDRGINIVDHWTQSYRDIPGARNWVTIHSPHYIREPITNVMDWQQRAKISVSLPGAGVVCFRHSEACVGSIMALPEDSLSWVYPWRHGENCIRLNPDRLFEDLEEATHRNDLYEIYLACQETADKYRSERLVNEYVIPNILARKAA